MPALDDAPALLFFAFRALTAEPDRILAERGLGRVHHRILYFIARRPGLRVGELRSALGVSKQALHRPLNALVRLGLVAARVPPADRRSKELRLTLAGARLERRLTGSQRRRFRRAFSAEGVVAAAGWRDVMRRLALSERGSGPRLAPAGAAHARTAPRTDGAGTGGLRPRPRGREGRRSG